MIKQKTNLQLLESIKRATKKLKNVLDNISMTIEEDCSLYSNINRIKSVTEELIIRLPEKTK